MTDREEDAYTDGQKSVYRRLLTESLRELELTGKDKDGWLIERAEIVAKLRQIFRDFAIDFEWPDDASLTDVLEKVADELNDLHELARGR